ncbi:MAG: hypothetical protein ABIJ95_02580, partial [Pseudomonadota bacterium]
QKWRKGMGADPSLPATFAINNNPFQSLFCFIRFFEKHARAYRNAHSLEKTAHNPACFADHLLGHSSLPRNHPAQGGKRKAVDGHRGRRGTGSFMHLAPAVLCRYPSLPELPEMASRLDDQQEQ